MSLTVTTCKHSTTEIEGEIVCMRCGKVFGYSEVANASDWKTHNIGNFLNHDTYGIISKMAANLYLPPYAVQTILQVSSKIRRMQITKKQSILYATVYSCRIHNIPRLLEDVFFELEKSSGRKIRRSEKTLLKLLNRIAKRIQSSEVYINPPNKDYYLQAYLAKIQDIVIKETDGHYFEMIRARSLRQISDLRSDPSTAAKEAILQSTCRIVRSKVRGVLV